MSAPFVMPPSVPPALFVFVASLITPSCNHAIQTQTLITTPVTARSRQARRTRTCVLLHLAAPRFKRNEGVVVRGAALPCAGKARAKLERLGRRQRQHRVRKLCLVSRPQAAVR
eukprot:COSAG06_NODE_571_length_14101_cov_12.481682_4_plen_114_part_00